MYKRQVADSVYGAISSGIDTADAIGVVEEATKLAVGSFTDTTTAVDILSAAINAYGLESSQASQMSDYLITMQTLTKTSVGELAANMQAKMCIRDRFYPVGLARWHGHYAQRSEQEFPA